MATPELSSDTQLSTAGYFHLTWSDQSPKGVQSKQYELQQADNNTFSNAKILYTGPGEASVISGLPDKTYYYRVRLTNEDHWSKPVEIEVKHHPLIRAFGFFTLGAVMFAATVITLIHGARGRNRS